MDDFDPFAEDGVQVTPDLAATVVSFDSDWRFGPEHGAALAAGLRERGAGSVHEVVLPTDAGHDAFLLSVPGYQELVAAALAG